MSVSCKIQKRNSLQDTKLITYSYTNEYNDEYDASSIIMNYDASNITEPAVCYRPKMKIKIYFNIKKKLIFAYKIKLNYKKGNSYTNE